MKILIATDNYYPNVNGASYFTQRLAQYLLKHNQEVLVLAPARGRDDERFKQDGVNIFGLKSLPIERIRFAWPFGSVTRDSIEKALREFQPDVVHIQSHFAISRKTAQAAKRLGIPVIGTNHFMPENLVTYLPLPENLRNKTKKLFWQVFLRVFNSIDLATSPTQTAADILPRIGLKKPVKVVSNGIDLSLFKTTNNGEYLRGRYNLPNRPLLLFVGRLDPEKKIDFVLRSLVPIINRTDLQLVLVGSGAEKENLQNLAESLGLSDRVTFTGFVPDIDLPNIYALATAFVMPGVAELQSIVTMEAMATGLPVIAVRAVALPELVHDNVNGYLYEENDSQRLGECILNIFSNQELREKMGRGSLEIIGRHDINKIITTFLGLYEVLIKTNKHGASK